MIKILLWVHLLIFLFLVIAGSPPVYADSMSADYIKVEVTSISYIGNNNYRVKIALLNESAKDYLIIKFENKAQTDNNCIHDCFKLFFYRLGFRFRRTCLHNAPWLTT